MSDLPGRSLWRRRITVFVSVVAVVLGAAYVYLDRPIPKRERIQVQMAAVRLLTTDVATGQMPADLKERRRVVETQADERRAALAEVWIPGVRQIKAREWEDSLQYFVADATYDAFKDNRFVVTEWRTVTRFIGGIKVVFRGQMSYLDAKSGEWHRSVPGTEHLYLMRINGEWRLAHESLRDYNPS